MQAIKNSDNLAIAEGILNNTRDRLNACESLVSAMRTLPASVDNEPMLKMIKDMSTTPVSSPNAERIVLKALSSERKSDNKLSQSATQAICDTIAQVLSKYSGSSEDIGKSIDSNVGDSLLRAITDSFAGDTLSDYEKDAIIAEVKKDLPVDDLTRSLSGMLKNGEPQDIMRIVRGVVGRYGS